MQLAVQDFLRLVSRRVSSAPDADIVAYRSLLKHFPTVGMRFLCIEKEAVQPGLGALPREQRWQQPS